MREGAFAGNRELIADMTKNHKMDLTIVTVCRNARNLLLPTLESVVNQKAKEVLRIEHLIIDGASTDGTPEWLAELQAAGKIENYISEPDSGIYDAMNKGIRLARGKVLYFLNAGDVLLSVSALETCIRPLLSDEAQHAAAPVLRSLDGRQEKDFPCFEYVYLRTPCCHQGYFALTDLYRSIGGYDLSYRCLADADFMCRAYAEIGTPIMTEVPVALYPDDGFSSNCAFHYLPEYIEMTHRNWSAVLCRCKVDPAYCHMVQGVLTERCLELARWQQTRRQDISGNVAILQQQLRSLARRCWHPLRWGGMLWAAAGYLPRLRENVSISPRREKMMYWVSIACSMRPGNKYAFANGYPVRSLKKALWAKLCSLFKR